MYMSRIMVNPMQLLSWSMWKTFVVIHSCQDSKNSFSTLMISLILYKHDLADCIYKFITKQIILKLENIKEMYCINIKNSMHTVYIALIEVISLNYYLFFFSHLWLIINVLFAMQVKTVRLFMFLVHSIYMITAIY